MRVAFCRCLARVASSSAECLAESRSKVSRASICSRKSAACFASQHQPLAVPPAVFQYRLGNRSALDWVIGQYRVTEDGRSGVVSDPNREEDSPCIVRLFQQVVHVSVETTKIVDGLPAEFTA